MSLKKVVNSRVDHALQLLLLAYHRLALAHRIHPLDWMEMLPLHSLAHLCHLPHLPHLSHLAHLVTGIHRMHITYFLDLLVESARVVSFGSGYKLPKSIVNDVIVVKKLLLLALVGSAHLIEFPDVLIFHLLHHREVSAFACRVFQVHVCEIGEVYVHFADGSQQLGPIKGSLRLHY